MDVDFTLVKRGLYYIRNKSLPDSPKSIDDIVSAFEEPTVKEFIGKSKHKNADVPFFVGCHEQPDKSFAYCVFKSQCTIDLMNQHIPDLKQRDILMDSTFKCCPIGPFKQLLIIYIRYQDKVSYLIFLVAKTENR